MTIKGLLLVCLLVAAFFGMLVGGIDLLICGKDSFVMKPFEKQNKYKDAMNDYILVTQKNWTTKRKPIKEFPTITFKQFQDFYYLNPASWTLQEYRVFKNHNEELSFVFEYKEWKEYNKWHKQILKAQEIAKKQKLNQDTINSQNETTRKILEEVQKDIDRIRKESQKNIDEGIRLIKEVLVTYD